MKKIISMILALVLSAGASAVVSSASAHPYTDVAENVWYGKAAEFCYLNSFMTGTSEGVFSPANSMTRAQIAVILAKLGKADLSEYTSPSFIDVPAGTWYSAPVEWLKDKEIAAGTGGGLFDPNGVITREQFALLLKKFAEVSGVDTSDRADLSVYPDLGEAHVWANDALAWAVSSHIINGIASGETLLLSPLGTVTRAQTAVMVRAFTLDTLYGDHDHDWEGPSCTESSFCKECGIIGERALGHDDSGVTCTQGCECPRCGTYLAPFGHSPLPATCTEPSKCERCGDELAPALGHTTENGICARCHGEVFPNGLERIKFYLKDAKITPDAPYKIATGSGAVFTLCFDSANGAVIMSHSYTDDTGATIIINAAFKDMETKPHFDCLWKNIYGTVAAAEGEIEKEAFVNASTVPDFTMTQGSSLLKGQLSSLIGYYIYDGLKAADGILKTYLKTDITALGFENIKF